MSRIRVLLVDDHALMCEGLRAFLSYYDDVEVVGDARDGAQAIAQVRQLRPDAVLMDVAMPVMNGIDATRVICEEHPQTKVLVVTQHDDRQYVVPLLQAGASGYILKRALGSDLIGALRTVARGETYLDPAVSTILAEEMRRPSQSLTPREQQILQRIVHGETSPQIAAALSLSIKTVEWHRNNLMSKLHAHNVADLVRIALQRGLIASEE